MSMETPKYRIVENQTYNIKNALCEILSSTIANEILLEIEKEDKILVEVSTQRTALRDIVEDILGNKAKELMRLSPEYSKAVIAELKRQLENELYRIKSIFDMEQNTNARGELVLIGSTQNVYNEIDKELDNLLNRVSDEQIMFFYLAVKDGKPASFLIHEPRC